MATWLSKLTDFSGFFLGAVTGAFGVVTMFFYFAQQDVKPADWIDFYGALAGSSITILGAVVVFQFQNETADQRHLGTMTSLLKELGTAGDAMRGEGSELDPARHVEEARVSYATTLAVAEELQANGPRIARLAVQLRESAVRRKLVNFGNTINEGGGIADDDLKARGAEVRQLADQLLTRLNVGL